MRLHALMPVLLLAAGPVFGQTSTCTASASATNFGTYSPTSPSALDGTGNVQVSCSLLGVISILVSYQIQLSAGTSGSSASRTLSGPDASLTYNLYTNASRMAIWGDGSGGSSTVSDGYLLGLLTTVKNYPVYGRIVAGQNVPPGSYGDTIVVTVNY
jgi:spore coat protein U-like protein